MKVKKLKVSKKHVPSDAELANDPSLRWTQYQKGEALISDTHRDMVRFLRYEKDGIVVASLSGFGEMPGVFNVLSIRRR